MKRIIAPVDFSDASTNALSFAIELSKRANAGLVIVHILPDGEDEKEAESKLKGLESEIKKGNVAQHCISMLAKGKFVSTLENIIDTQQPDLLVMGTKGASGLKRILIGSNTVNVITNTKVPVLVIPEVARFENFLNKGKNRIVLATDLEAVDNEDALEILKQIAILIREPRVKVLSVRREHTDLDYLKRMERKALISLFNPEIESESATVFSDTIMSGINFYLDKSNDTGLLAMIARDSGAIIERHYTREMASHTRYPLLVLHDSKI
jgi:nucleotide-binding universal stress UspA family protein